MEAGRGRLFPAHSKKLRYTKLRDTQISNRGSSVSVIIVFYEFIKYLHCVSKKTGPLLHFQITPTILVQSQQTLVQRIVN